MNICIVEDHYFVAQALQTILSSTEVSHKIKIFGNGESFLAENFTVWQPEIIILDIRLPGIDGLTVIDKALEKNIDGKFLLLSSITDITTVKAALHKKNVSGFLSKDATKEEVLEAINQIVANGRYINDSLKNKLIDNEFLNFGSLKPAPNLSKREKQILEKMRTCGTHKEIAYEMGLSVYTINNYIRNMLGKLKLNSSTELTLYAHGIYKQPNNQD